MTTAAPASAPARAKPREVRPEIQALRAAAVAGVVLFHLWPGRLTGGYAGVDVFFVISGFLITAHLLREADRRHAVALGRFWARRVRRLLPAATLVLAVTAVGVFVAVPRTYWHQNFVEIIASATYWENWRLAAESVDYLGAENAPSAVQHYWSLSLEEQFYIIWPLLLVAVLAFVRWRGARIASAFAVVLGAILVLSFSASVVSTAVQPAVAYFATYTRMWEFALGGLLALAVSRGFEVGRRWQMPLELLGWLAIGATFVFFTTATPFPGFTAALPALGTAAVIAAGTTRTWLGRFGASRPIQSLGDNSYSMYLWHWPPIVILPYALGRHLKFAELAGLAVATYLLAVVTKRLVEDPVRNSAFLTRSTAASYAMGALSIVIVVSIAAAGLASTARAADRSENLTNELIKNPRVCLGAAAVLGDTSDCDDTALKNVLLPEPGSMKEDTGNAYKCYETKPTAKLNVCTYGSTKTDALKVAIVGDSHAASLIPGISALAAQYNWTLDTYVARGCTWVATDSSDPCYDHRTALAKRFDSGKYDVILVATRRTQDVPAGEPDPAAAANAQAWAPAIDAGTTVVAITDNPTVTDTASACLEQAADYSSASKCSMSASQAWKLNDPLPQAVQLAGQGALLVDTRDAFCDDVTCPMVEGHVGVYRDTHHITATYSRTLAPFLMDRITTALAGTASASPSA